MNFQNIDYGPTNYTLNIALKCNGSTSSCFPYSYILLQRKIASINILHFRQMILEFVLNIPVLEGERYSISNAQSSTQFDRKSGGPWTTVGIIMLLF